ncbi:MAG TPA: hypothetical protein VMR98_04530, partial [Candidatus Polarisedimenticolaceae bacterium]|nr:hypothetical protein [Candidatus Polarisedimenticolaceae bacterium]
MALSVNPSENNLTPPPADSTPPVKPRRDVNKGLAAGAVVFIFLCAIAGYFIIKAGSSVSEVLNGSPITIDDDSIKSMARKDIQPLLERDYPTYYKNAELSDRYRPGFEKAVSSLVVSGGCRFEVGKIDKRQGGLDVGPNAVDVSGLATCKATS